MSTPTGSAAPQPPRHPRRPPRPVEVVGVERLTPRLVSVRLGGEALDGFRIEAPTSHIKVFLPAEGESSTALPIPGPDGPVWPEDAPRPVMRTYTPRRFDEATGTLEVQFVLHGEGPASAWAERAAIGDRIAVAGPGGRFALDPAAERWWIAGDESAIPAVATLLEALPPTAAAEVHLEVSGPEDELDLAAPAGIEIVWHHRKPADNWGGALADAARDASLPEGTRVWVACEAAAMRGIRRHLRFERSLPLAAMVTHGYWKLGDANHPDHDYGDDD
jgi:NADPH-dependent ferric siderophore reductase